MDLRSPTHAALAAAAALAAVGARAVQADASWIVPTIVMGTPSLTGTVIATPIPGGGGYLVLPLNLMYSPHSGPQVDLVRVAADGSVAWKRRMTMPAQDFAQAITLPLANQDTFVAMSAQGGCVASLIDSAGNVRASAAIDDGNGHPLACMSATEAQDHFVTVFASNNTSPSIYPVVVRFAPHSLDHETPWVSSSPGTFERHFRDGAGNEYITGADLWPNPNRLYRVDAEGLPTASIPVGALAYAPAGTAGMFAMRRTAAGAELVRFGADLSTAWSLDVSVPDFVDGSIGVDRHGDPVALRYGGSSIAPALTISGHLASTGAQRWTTTLPGVLAGTASLSPSGSLVVAAARRVGDNDLRLEIMRYSDSGVRQWITELPPPPPLQLETQILPASNDAVVVATFAGHPSVTAPVLRRIEADGSLGASYPIGASALPTEARAIMTASDGTFRTLLRFPEGHCGVVARAANGDLMWEQDFAVEWQDCAIATDDAGNTLLGGTMAFGFSDSTIKLGPTGAVLWTRTLPPNSQPFPRYMVPLPGGDTLIMRAPPGTTEVTTSLVRLSPGGMVTSETMLANNASPNGLWRAPDGRIFASTREASDLSHLWVLNANGTPAWNRVLNVALSRLAFLADGSIAAIGQMPVAPGRVSLALERISGANGVTLASTILSTRGMEPSEPAELADGSLVIGFGDNGKTRVMRIAANGSVGWQRELWPHDITWGGAVLDGGQIIMAGMRYSYWPQSDYDSRAFMVAIDATGGETLWDSGLDAPSCTFVPGCTSGAITDMQLQQDGSIVTAGWEDHPGFARTAYLRRAGSILFADGFDQ